MMWSVVLLMFGGMTILAVVISARILEARSWRSQLSAYRLVPPNGLVADDIARWITNIASVLHQPRWSLLPLPPLCLEVVATASHGITYYVLVSKSNEAQLLSGLRSSLTGIRLEEEPD